MAIPVFTSNILRPGDLLALSLFKGGVRSVNPFPNASSAGYLNAPGYTGALTPFNGPFVAGQTYSFKLIDGGTVGTEINTAGKVTLVGCLITSNQTGYYNLSCAGGDLDISYCTLAPRTSIVTAPPGGFVWPSRSSGQITQAQGYQSGVFIKSTAGNIKVDHCDIWGFAQAADISGRTLAKTFTFTYNWVHDARNDGGAGGGQDHTDGPGAPSDNNAQQGITISNNTIASIGNTNAIAMQAGPYDGLVVTGNYLSGFGTNLAVYALSAGLNAINQVVTDNIFATDIPWLNAAVYDNPYGSTLAMFAHNNNLWKRNKIKVISGTSPVGVPSFTMADNGKFMLPDNSLSVTDNPDPTPVARAFVWATHSTDINVTGSSTVVGSTNANASPGTIYAGNDLFAVVLVSATSGAGDTGAISIPGFTAVQQAFLDTSGNADTRLYVGHKKAGSSETGTYTASWANTPIAARGISWALLNYTGLDASNPIDVSAIQTNTSYSTNMPAPSVSASVAGLLLTVHTGFGGQTTYGAPSGMTLRSNTGSASSDRPEILVAELQLSATGATGVKNATQAGVDQSGAVSMVLK